MTASIPEGENVSATMSAFGKILYQGVFLRVLAALSGGDRSNDAL